MSTELDRPRLVPPVSERDHIQGAPNALVTLVEYGDFECPHCGAAYPIVHHIQKEMGERMCLAYRHFPLATAHPHAGAAAEAAEAAGAQGQFWEMHDLLFENQQQLEYEDLFANAEFLGLDLKAFERDLLDHTYAARVQEDFRSGIRSGVNGTPTFFINDVRYNGRYDMESLLAAMA